MRSLRERQWAVDTNRPACRAGPRSITRDSVVPFLDRNREWDGNIVSGSDTFVTAIGAGTNLSDYKPAPFIISSKSGR